MEGKIKNYLNSMTLRNEVLDEIYTLKIIAFWIGYIENSMIKMKEKIIKTNRGVLMGSKWAPLMFNWSMGSSMKEFYKKYTNKARFIYYANDLFLNCDANKVMKIFDDLIITGEFHGLKLSNEK